MWPGRVACGERTVKSVAGISFCGQGEMLNRSVNGDTQPYYQKLMLQLRISSARVWVGQNIWVMSGAEWPSWCGI